MNDLGEARALVNMWRDVAYNAMRSLPNCVLIEDDDSEPNVWEILPMHDGSFQVLQWYGRLGAYYRGNHWQEWFENGNDRGLPKEVADMIRNYKP